MTTQFTRKSFFNQSSDKQRRNKSSLYYGVKRTGVMAKYSGFLATTCLVGLAVTQNKAMASPQGGNVVGGNANITVTGAQTNIIQSSNRAAIDWQSFSVAANESVNFTVPNGGATLNRVVGSQASLIQGTVRSNGTLYLVNPNGLVLDAGSQISAQNFIASTSNIDPAKFMQGGKVTLGSSATNARISLKGTITAADRGIVGIFAPKVVNEGTIIANLGSVVLAGVQSSVIDFTGDGLINFELGATTGRNGENLLASNKGVINASGGHVTLTAQGAESLFNAIVENTGSINATSLSAKGGTVTLKSNLGSVKDSGTIEASGTTGGGEVLVWASEYADYTGDIKAEALANHTSSNGGAVEISGLKYLNFNGTVSTLSHNGGKTGSLLLDPTDIEIVATAPASGTAITVNNNSFTGVGTNNTSYILASNLTTALASNNVTVDATAAGSGTGTGKITVSTGIAWTSGKSLTLTAGAGGIAINAAINGINSADATKNAELTLTSVGTISEGAAGTISVGTISAISSAGDVILDNGGNNGGRFDSDIKVGVMSGNAVTYKNFYYFTVTGAITARSGDLKLTSGTSAIIINNSLTADGHIVELSANAYVAQSSAGIITAGTLKVEYTANNYNLVLDNVQNKITNLGRIKVSVSGSEINYTSKNITIANSVGFAVTDINTPTTGTLSLTAATGNITQTAVIRATTLKATATAGDVILTNTSNAITNLDTSSGKNISVTNSTALNIGGDVTVQDGGALNLITVSGDITQNIANIITTPTLNVTAGGNNGIALGNVGNKIGAFGTLSFGSSKDLTIGNHDSLSIAQNLSTTGTINLISGGGIATTGTAKISAGTLKGSAAGDVNIAANITNLGAFTVTGNKNFTLTNDAAVTISDNVSVSGGIVNIIAGGGITTDTGKKITALTVMGSATDAVGLNASVTNLGAFTVTGSNNFSLTNDKALNISGAVTDSAGTVNLVVTTGGISKSDGGKITADKLTGSAAAAVEFAANVAKLGAFSVTNNGNFTLTNDAALTISDNVSVSGGIVNIIAGGGITTDSGKKITALTVMGSASDAVDIKTNVTNLGAFTVTGNKNFTLTNDVALVVSGDVAAAGGVVRLVATAGGISGSGKITALTVGGSATGAVNLLSNVTNLGAFTVTGGGNFTLVNDGALVVTGAVSGADVSLTASGTGGAISQGAAASLTVSGALTVNSVGAVNLTGVNNNAITKLAAINGSSIAIRNSVALSLTGNIATTGGAITIDNSYGSTDASKNITLDSNVTISGGNVTLDLGGGTSGTTHTAGGGTLATGNYVLKSFSGDKSFDLTILAGGFSFGTTANTVYIDAGTATLATATGATTFAPNAQGVILVGAAYTDSKGTVYAASVASSPGIFTGAAIASGDRAKVNAGKVKTFSDDELIYSGDIYINGGTTDFTSITSTGGRVLFVGNYSDASGLIVNAKKGIVIGATITATSGVTVGNLSLNAIGGITETGAGLISGGILSVNAVGGVNLTGSNLITKLGDLSNSGGGNISITNGQTANVASGSTWSNKNGMIIVKLTTGNLNLLGDMTVATGTTALRVDLGLSANITSSTGTNTISGKGVDVYYSGKSDGNGVKFNLGATAAVGNTPAVAGGVFTHVADATPKSGSSETIDKAYTVPVTTSFLSLGAASGITVVNNDGTTPAAQPVLGKGLRFGNAVAVTIDGNWPAVTAANAATNPGTLRWIEGGTINVKSNTSFAGSIVLAATGSPTTPMVNGRAATSKVAAANDLHANLYVAGTLTAAKDVILLQNGAVSTPDLLASGKMASNAPGADAYGIYAVGAVTATNGSVIMAQNGKVESKAGSAAGIRANSTITGKIGVDIYNGGAVTANQTATNLTVSANGVQLLGAVSTGSALAANNLSLNNNGDIAANNLTNAVVLGLATTAMDAQAKKDAATAFNTAATNAANAEIAGATPGAGAKIVVSGRDYLIGTADQKKAAVAAFVAHYLANNEAVLADIAARKGALVLAGKSVSATGVNAAAALTSGNVTVGNNGTVTGGSTATSYNPTVSGTGLLLAGDVSAKAGKVTVSQSGDVTGITSATGASLKSASSTGIAHVSKSVDGAAAADVTASVSGGVSLSASGAVTSNATIGKSMGLVVSGNVIGTLGKVDISQNGVVQGGASATGISLGTVTVTPTATTVTGVTSTGSAHKIVTSVVATKTQIGNAAATTSIVTTVTTTDAVEGGLSVSQAGDVTAGAGNATGIAGTTLTGTMAPVSVTQSGAVTGTGATGIGLSGAVTSSNVVAGSVTPAPAVAVATSKSGATTTTKTTTTTTTTVTKSVTGDVAVSQTGDVKGTVGTAKAIALAGVTGASGVSVTQNSKVEGNVDAYGISASGAIGSSHGTVNLSNTTGKTINATTGRAFGINLAGTVSAGARGATSSITIEQNATVTASAGSAAGISTAAITLANDLAVANTSKISVTNNGAVTANQSKTNQSVTAVGVVTGAVTGGNLKGYEVTIKNTGIVTAKSLGDNDKSVATFATTEMISKAKSEAAAKFKTASESAASTAIDGITVAPTAKITIGGKDYKLTNATEKAAAKTAYAAHYLATNQTVLDDIELKKSTAVLAGKSVSATGVVASGVSSGGNVTLTNSGDITNNKDVSGGAITLPQTGTVSSTGVLVSGAVTANAGLVLVTQTGAVTGVRSATGISLNSASGRGLAHVSKSVDGATATDVSLMVAGGVTLNESGTVSSDLTRGKAIGIAVTGNVTATVGKVDIAQSGTVHGGVSATGISVTGVTSTGVGDSKVTSVVSTKTQNGNAAATTKIVTTVTTTEAVAGELKLNQSGEVKADAGNATGIAGTTLTGTLAPVIVSQSAKVTGTGGAATGIGLSGAVTSSNVIGSGATPVSVVGVTTSKSGTTTTTITTKTTTVTNSVTGDVKVSQTGDVSGTVSTAKAISLAGVTGASGVSVTQNSKVDGNVDAYGISASGAIGSSHGTVNLSNTADKTITANTGRAFGIKLGGTVSAGARGSSDKSSITIEQNATVTGTAGSAIGISTAGIGLANDLAALNDSAISVTNNGAVTANQSAGNLSVSAVGVMTGAVTGGNQSLNNVTIKNTGAVTANNLTITDAMALSYATAEMIAKAKADAAAAFKTQATAAGTAANSVIDAIAQSATAKITIDGKNYPLTNADQRKAAKSAHYLAMNAAVLADIDARKKVAVLGGKIVSATGVSVVATKIGDVLVGANAGGTLAISNSGDISHGSNGSSQNYVVSATGISLTGTQNSGKAQTITQSGAITGLTSAIGVSESGSMQAMTGDLTVQSIEAKEVKTETSVSTLGTATGLLLTGTATAKAGKVTVKHDGKVTGYTSATGIFLNSASGRGVAHVSKSVDGAAATDVTAAVEGGVTLNESGNVRSDLARGKAIGIVVTGNVTATVGKVDIVQSGTVHGGVSATGISVGTVTVTPTATLVTGVTSTGSAKKIVTSAVATKTQNGTAAATTSTVTTVTTTDAVAGELKLNQSGEVKAGAGNATGIAGTTLTGTLAPVIVSQSGAVTGTGGAATGIGLSGAVTSSNFVGTSVAVPVTTPTKTVGAVKTTITTTTTTVTNSVKGDVAVSQTGDVSGTVSTAKAISLAGVTGASGVSVTQKGDVTGKTDAYGISASGAIGSSNGAVTVTTSLDNSVTPALAKTITANTGRAFGIKLDGAVTTGVAGLVDAVTITVEQNSTVQAEKGSATGVSTVGLNLTKDMAVANTSGIIVTNNGAVTATQSAGNLSVSAIGVVTGAVVGGTRAANNVTITNAGVVKAINLDANGETALATAKLTADAALSGKSVSATGVSVVNTSAGGVLTISNSGNVTAGTNTTTRTTARKYTLSATGLNLNGALASGGNQIITQTGVVAGFTSSVDTIAVGSIKSANGQGTLSFTALNGIDAKGAVITAGTVSAFSGVAATPAGSVLLNNAGNVIANFGAISAGSFDIGSSIQFNLTGNLVKTSTANGSLMKVSNYTKDKGIGIISTNINATGSNLTFSFKGTGKFLTTGQGSVTYVNQGVTPNTTKTIPTAELNAKSGNFAGSGVTIVTVK